MKLSNKILIGFFGFIFLYLTAVFAEIRLRGTPNIMDDANSIAESVDISGISYLVLDDLDVTIGVIGSDESRIEVRSLSGDLLQRLKYNLSGDTLILSELESQGTSPVKISVFVPQTGLSGIRVDSAFAIVTNLDQAVLDISQNAGSIRISDSRIGKVHVSASHGSQFHLSATAVDTLSATIDESQVHLSSPLKHLKGSMQNNAFLRVQDIGEIRFKKDSSSRFNVYY